MRAREFIAESSNIKQSVAEAKDEGLVLQFLKSITPKELRYYSIRDNCGPAALHMMDWAKEKGIELHRVNGYFVADNVVYDKADFTKEMKHEFLQQGLDFNDPKSRQEFIASNPKYSKEWKKVPHYWLQDDRGTVYDPTGYIQFIKTGLAKDLDKSRYETVQGVAEGGENFNIALMKPGFRWSEEINGITYLVRTQWDNMPEVIARVNNREVGRATFIDHHTRSGLESVSTYVSPKWQGHGIAKNMYAVIRMLGANIQPSATQTDMGKDMWAKWKKGGDTKHLTSMNAKTDQQGVAENFLDEGLRVDVPNEEWLQDAIDYAKQKSPDRNGLPYMGKTTATVRSVDVPVDILKRIPGMRREQQNVRQADLAAIIKIMSDTGKLPLGGHTGEEYKPFINVSYDGSAWINEGNHRIMAAAKLGWKTLPVEISYFDGGERVESGAMYPPKIGLGQVSENFADGKGPGRPGDSVRHGIPKHATMAELEKASHAKGRKGQLARWQLNMRNGHKK